MLGTSKRFTFEGGSVVAFTKDEAMTMASRIAGKPVDVKGPKIHDSLRGTPAKPKEGVTYHGARAAVRALRAAA